jgi:hypothetical protein
VSDDDHPLRFFNMLIGALMAAGLLWWLIAMLISAAMR